MFYLKLADGRSGIAKARPATSIATPQVVKTGNTATLSLPSHSNRDYQLEVLDSASGAYLVLGEQKRGATGTAVTFTDANASSSTRIYRVRVLPVW